MHGELQRQLAGWGQSSACEPRSAKGTQKRLQHSFGGLKMQLWRRLVQCTCARWQRSCALGAPRVTSGLLSRAAGAGRLHVQGDAGAGGRQGAGVEGARRELRVHQAHQPPGLQGRRAEGGAAPELRHKGQQPWVLRLFRGKSKGACVMPSMVMPRGSLSSRSGCRMRVLLSRVRSSCPVTYCAKSVSCSNAGSRVLCCVLRPAAGNILNGWHAVPAGCALSLCAGILTCSCCVIRAWTCWWTTTL